MQLRVQLFAAAKQRAGRNEVAVDLPERATVAQLRAALAQSSPALADLLPHCVFAVGGDYALETSILSPEVEVACIPPVSGG